MVKGLWAVFKLPDSQRGGGLYYVIQTGKKHCNHSCGSVVSVFTNEVRVYVAIAL